MSLFTQLRCGLFGHNMKVKIQRGDDEEMVRLWVWRECSRCNWVMGMPRLILRQRKVAG